MLQISSFSIEALNGVFNYQECSAQGSLKDLIILYGDNGTGKTTILQLIFHLLSVEPGRGHLTAIERVPFRSLKISFSDGTTLIAERKNSVSNVPIIFKLTRPDASAAVYEFIPEKIKDRVLQERIKHEMAKSSKSRENKVKHSSAVSMWLNTRFESPHSNAADHAVYIAALKRLDLRCYFMATDRRIRSDALEEANVNSRQTANIDNDDEGVIPRVRARYLREAMNNASRYINRQLIRASNTGSKNTNDIFVELISRIANEDLNAEKVNLETRVLTAKSELESLEIKNRRFSNLGIAPTLNFQAIKDAIVSATASKRNTEVLEKVLRPYIDSLDARLYALNPVGDVIETFLKLLNNLFKFKSVSFSPSQGFTICGISRDDSLEIEQLSSGEQQLLLMFCYLLISNEHQSIFIIDEPEISLNVKWQRELIDAMRLITKDSQTQILIATHSIELLTQYSDMVIQLDPEITNNKILSNATEEED